MNTSVEKLEGNRIRITVSHTAEEVDGAVKDAYARVSRTAKIQGFRPGKAPRNVVDSHVGRDNVLADALERLVETSYALALEEHKIRPIESPDTGDLDGLVEGEEHTYNAEVDVRPELTLNSIEGVKAVIDITSTTEADIDAQLEMLRDRYATLEVVEDRGVGPHDFVLMSFSGTVDGKPADDLVVDKYLYEMGKGIMPVGFDNAVMGSKVGETVHSEFSVPTEAANREYAGKAAAFNIEIHEIKTKIMPALDDEFAANVGGFETIGELRDDIRRHLDEGKFANRMRVVERAALDDLVTRLEGGVPTQMVTSRARTMAEEFIDSLQERGMTTDDYAMQAGIEADEIFSDIQAEAALRVRDELALEALFRAADLEYTDEELDGEIATIAGAEKEPVDTIRERLIANGAMGIVRERLMHRRASAWLMANAEIIEKAPDELEASEEAPKAAKPKAKKAAAKKPAKKAAATEPAPEPAGSSDEKE